MTAANFEGRKRVSAVIWRICLQVNVLPLRNSPLKKAFFWPSFSLSTQKANAQLSQYVGEKQCWFIILHTHLKEVYDALLEKWEASTATFHRLFRILLLTNLVCLQWNRCSTWICAAVFFFLLWLSLEWHTTDRSYLQNSGTAPQIWNRQH